MLTFVGSLVLCLLSYAEHEHSVRPSLILSAYLFFSLIFDIARVRTLWLILEDGVIAIVMTTVFVVKFLILGLESMEKRSILAPEYQNYPPEATTGMFGQSVFWWLNSLFLQGSRKILFLDDLCPLDRQLYSERLHQQIQSAWATGLCIHSSHANFVKSA